MSVAISLLTAVGIAAFALSGALMAVRKRMDVVGMFVLAAITAVGGGLLRDVLLDVPASALRTPWWWALIGVATVIVFYFKGAIDRLRRAVLVTDAVGLGIFCATSTALALNRGLGPFEAVVIGVIGGVAGGVLRDVLAGEIPSVLRRDTKVYALPAVFGCLLVVVGYELGARGDWLAMVAGAAITIVRLLALWRGWSAPAPKQDSAALPPEPPIMGR
ncbi:MAG: trimeric intracellular cation channel family protein [Beutenbergiaceae bacterium]